MDAIKLMLLTGEWLLYLLAFILCIRPLVKYDRRFSPLFKYRKQFGWLFGALTLVHIAIYLFLYLDKWSFILTLFDDIWFITGLIATVISLALTATSNKWSMKKLKAKWKLLHKAVYAIGFLGILHGELASKQLNKGLYVFLIIFVLLMLWRYRNVFWIVALVGAILYGIQIAIPQKVQTLTPVTDMEEGTEAWELCGQYGLNYETNGKGFYNCTKPF